MPSRITRITNNQGGNLGNRYPIKRGGFAGDIAIPLAMAIRNNMRKPNPQVAGGARMVRGTNCKWVSAIRRNAQLRRRRPGGVLYRKRIVID
jgi:hypothetical protein